MLKRVTGGLVLLMCSKALALTPTPTAVPCATFGPPSLSASLDVQPAHPVVGDHVVLTFRAFGSGGLPQYALVGGPPVLEGTPGTVRDSTFGNPVSFELTAAQAGTAMVALGVNFESAFGCVDHPMFQFVTLTTDPFAVEVVAPAATPSNTPTRTPPPQSSFSPTNTPSTTRTSPSTPTPTATQATPTPTSNRVPPVAVASASPNPARAGERVTLSSSGSHGPISQIFWSQQSGPVVALEGCLETQTQLCEAPSVQFTAPIVKTETMLVFELRLTSFGSTSGSSAQIAVKVLAAQSGHHDDDSCSIAPPAPAQHAALLLVPPIVWIVRRRQRSAR